MKISVILPAYRAVDTLRGCAKSVLQNAPKDLELILVDDGSPDGTGRLCDELAARDKRVTALHRPNGGASAARNTGLDAARGEYITFVDADDALLPGLWQAALPALAAGQPDLYGFGVQRTDGVLECGPAKGFARPGELGEAELGRLLIDTGVLAAPYAKFYRASLLRRHHIRFDEALRVNEDILFNLHFLAVCGPLQFGPGAFYRYSSEGAGSLSRRLRDDLLAAEAYTRPAFKETLAALGLPQDAADRLVLRRRLHSAKAQFGLLAGQKGRLPLYRRRQLLAEIFAVPCAREALLADYRADPNRLLALPYRVCLRLGLPGLLAVYCAAKEHFL